jgi:hypothetical protein
VKITDSTSNAQRSTPNAQAAIDLHIEELVLHGFAPGERYAIGDAIERELVRLFGERDIPFSLQSENARDEVSGASFSAARDATSLMIGQQIAQAVYQGFGQ